VKERQATPKKLFSQLAQIINSLVCFHAADIGEDFVMVPFFDFLEAIFVVIVIDGYYSGL
jgi:hypothetical protein